jgi:hypothetical protein
MVWRAISSMATRRTFELWQQEEADKKDDGTNKQTVQPNLPMPFCREQKPKAKPGQ